MNALRIAAVLVLLGTWLGGCSEATQETEVRALVAPHFSHEGLETGDPVPGATLSLYQGDTVVMETLLDEAGTALIAPNPGTYDVQITLDSTDPHCFWGETVFGVTFPSSPLTMEVSFICTGQ